MRRPVPGDQVFLVGLFIEHPGADSRIQPLIRTGSVANEDATVDVQRDLSVEEWVSTNAYLIESRSWGGESGSPVFAYHENLKVEGTHPGFWHGPPNPERV